MRCWVSNHVRARRASGWRSFLSFSIAGFAYIHLGTQFSLPETLPTVLMVQTVMGWVKGEKERYEWRSLYSAWQHALRATYAIKLNYLSHQDEYWFHPARLSIPAIMYEGSDFFFNHYPMRPDRVKWDHNTSRCYYSVIDWAPNKINSLLID